VLTVLVGMVAVPVALYFTNVGPSPVLGPAITIASSARASGVTSPTPTPTPTPTKSP
jgi:hypothetical protein